MQLTHNNTHFEKRTFPIILICDNVTNTANIGSLFRIADAFGIKTLMLCGENISIGRKISKTSRATQKVVNFEICESAEKVVKNLKAQHYQIISLEITSSSKPLHILDFSKEKPIALVVGDENFGVSDAILNHSDVVVHINMFGFNSSMNVVQATNIALYELTKQLL